MKIKHCDFSYSLSGRYLQSDPIGLSTYIYGLNNPVSNIDPLGLDVCTYTSNNGYRHRWIENGGNRDRSYGWNPNGSSFFNPGVVENPDGNMNDAYSETCTASNSDQDDEIERWIKDNYDINNLDNTPNTNRNYNVFTYNCYSFANDVNSKLDEIIKRDVRELLDTLDGVKGSSGYDW